MLASSPAFSLPPKNVLTSFQKSCLPLEKSHQDSRNKMPIQRIIQGGGQGCISRVALEKQNFFVEARRCPLVGLEASVRYGTQRVLHPGFIAQIVLHCNFLQRSDLLSISVSTRLTPIPLQTLCHERNSPNARFTQRLCIASPSLQGTPCSELSRKGLGRWGILGDFGTRLLAA